MSRSVKYAGLGHTQRDALVGLCQALDRDEREPDLSTLTVEQAREIPPGGRIGYRVEVEVAE